jgi:hypothetical protein
MGRSQVQQLPNHPLSTFILKNAAHNYGHLTEAAFGASIYMGNNTLDTYTLMCCIVRI